MPRVIMTCFAGRRRNMEVLMQYVDELHSRGLVDEFHIWDFTRSREDSEWLEKDFRRSEFIRCENYEYVDTGRTLGSGGSIRARFKCSSDAHMLLTGPSGVFAEIAIGSHGNSCSLIRREKQGPAVGAAGGAVCDPNSWKGVSVEVRENGTIEVDLGGGVRMTAKMTEKRVNFPMRIHVSSWNGVGGCEWELPFDGDTRGERHYAKVFTVNNKKTWDEYYLHYTEQLYPDSIIIKTDDDIVFIDAESFEEFIHQRIRHEAPLLLFPNIVNNETCLVHQQSMGLAPGRLPPRALWGSGRNCLALHDSFLNNFDRWIESSRKRNDIVPVDRSERTNINFFAILSKDLHSYRLVASDPDKEDERVITTVATKTLLRSNFVSMKMTVAHLAFFKQRDTGLDEESVLEMYRELARKFLGRSRKSR